ncbi:MAG: hypothetical protein VW450_07630 [Chloroflexota bacterium]
MSTRPLAVVALGGHALLPVGQEPSVEGEFAAIGAIAVLDASPVDLGALVRVSVPIVPVGYELAPRGPGLGRALERFATRAGL